MAGLKNFLCREIHNLNNNSYELKGKKHIEKILLVKEDVQYAAQNLELIEKDDCTEETWKLIEESIECLDMSMKFLERIDISAYDMGCDGHNGEHIVLRKKRPRINKQ